MKYQDGMKDLRRRHAKHKREITQFAVLAKIRNFS
jgi:hypothetical protein